MKARLAMFAAVALASCGRGGGEANEANKAAALPPNPAPANITINTPEASAQVRTGPGAAAGALPGGLPAYPNAQADSNVNVTTQGGSGGAGGISGFRTSDPPAQVIAFYAAAVEGAGFRIVNRMDMGATATLTAGRDQGEAIQITATQVGGVTQVQIVAGLGR